MRKTAVTVTAAGACLLGFTVVGMGSALADPSGAPSYRQFVAVGSDTTEAVMNGLGNAITVNSSKVLGSYDASTGSAQVTTRGGNLAAASNVGDTTFTTAAPIYGAQVGDSVTLDSGAAAENATLAGALPTAAPWTYTVSAGLTQAHASGAALADNRCTFNRPVGSGAGRAALDASIRNATSSGSTAYPNAMGGCVDIARSSSYSSAVYGSTNELTYVPFGFDAVTFATLGTSQVPRQLTIGQLKSIYQCSYHAAGGTQLYQPLLPQSNSGTRQFFLSSIGLAGNALIPAAGAGGAVVEGSGTGLGSCVDSGSGPNQATAETPGSGFIENQGTVLANAQQLIPFSGGQFIAQVSGQQTNNLGRAALGAVDPNTSAVPATAARSALYVNPTTSAQDPNAVFPMTREVFNVVSTARITTGNAAFDQGLVNLLVGSNGPGVANNSLVCSNLATIQKFGFDPAPDCGDTSRKSG